MTDTRRDDQSTARCWQLTPLAAALLALASADALAAGTSDAYGVESNAGLSVYAAGEGYVDPQYVQPPEQPRRTVVPATPTVMPAAPTVAAPAVAAPAARPARPASVPARASAAPAPAATAAATPVASPETTSTTTGSTAASTAAPARSADGVPVLGTGNAKPLPSMDTAGERLGWMTNAEIAQLPQADRPAIDATCSGAWVTPISASTPVGNFEESDIAAVADNLSYRDNGEAVLDGQVRIKQTGRLLEADSGFITQSREYGRFDGNIRIAEPGLLLTGDQAVININTTAGQLLSSEFVSSQMHAHGRAERIRRFADGVMVIDRGIYTTCAPGNRAWSFEAKDIELNPNTGAGKVYHAKLRVGDVPVLYLPYFRFPIDDRRQSGILIPRFGNTSDGGFDFSLPVYLNLAPQYDATLTPRLLGNRGAMLESEFRYLTRDFGQGIVEAAILPQDQETGTDRKRAAFNHKAAWDNGWSARTSLNYVSDNFYFTDLGTDLTVANQTHQERVGEVRYDTDYWHVLGRVQGFQTIDPGLVDADKPYSRLPQLLLTTERARLPGWQRGLRAEVANFQRNIDDGSAPEINGTRLRLDPELRYEYRELWGYARPGIKVSHLQYALEGTGVTGEASPSLTIPTLSMDSGLYFERLFDNGGLQTLEPRLYYLYSPYKDQVALPNFDTANTTFGYDQLFRDTRFSGSDRIDDANQVSAGLTSRWLDSNGVERVQASLGQIVYLRDRQVRLPITGLTVPPVATTPTSSYAGNATVRVNDEVTAFGDFLMDPEGGRLSQYSVAVSALPQRGDRLYNAGYRFRRDDPTIGQKAVSQTQLSFVQPLGINWKVLGLWNYDLKARESQEALFGVSYESCCWQVRLFKRKFLADAAMLSNSSDRERDAIYVEVTLKGLAGLNSGVDSLFAKNVFGYTQLHKEESY